MSWPNAVNIQHYIALSWWNHENMTWSNRFSWKMTIFWRSPNFGQAFRELYWIILAYGNPPGSSYELFWHRKSKISNFRRNSSLVGQQLCQNSYQIWNLRTLNYRTPPWTCPPTIFSSPKIEKKKQDPCHFSSTSRNSWNECLRIFFYVIFDVEFDSDTPEIISLLFRIDFMRFYDFDTMCPTLTVHPKISETNVWESFSTIFLT